MRVGIIKKHRNDHQINILLSWTTGLIRFNLSWTGQPQRAIQWSHELPNGRGPWLQGFRGSGQKDGHGRAGMMHECSSRFCIALKHYIVQCISKSKDNAIHEPFLTRKIVICHQFHRTGTGIPIASNREIRWHGANCLLQWPSLHNGPWAWASKGGGTEVSGRS